MSSENLLKNGKKHVAIVGAGAAGMVSHAHLLGKNLLCTNVLFPGVESWNKKHDPKDRELCSISRPQPCFHVRVDAVLHFPCS